MTRRWPCYAESLYTFDAQEPDHLSFKKGQLIVVCECDDQDWWKGRISRSTKTGIFPSCLVYPTGNVVDDYDYDIELNISSPSLKNSAQSQKFNQAHLTHARKLQQNLEAQSSLHIVEQPVQKPDMHSQLLNLASTEIEYAKHLQAPKTIPIKLNLLYKDPYSNSSSSLNLQKKTPSIQNKKSLNNSSKNLISSKKIPAPTDYSFSSDSGSESNSIADEYVRQYMAKDGMVDRYFFSNNSAKLNNYSINKSSKIPTYTQNSSSDSASTDNDDNNLLSHNQNNSVTNINFNNSDTISVKNNASFYNKSKKLDSIYLPLKNSSNTFKPISSSNLEDSNQDNIHINQSDFYDKSFIETLPKIVDKPSKDSSDQNYISQNANLQNSTSQNANLQNSTSQNSTSQNATSQNATSQNSTSQNSTSQNANLQNSTSQNATSQNSTSQNATSQNSSLNSNISYRQYLLDSGLDKLTKIKKQNSIKTPNTSKNSINTTITQSYNSLKKSNSSVNKFSASYNSLKYKVDDSDSEREHNASVASFETSSRFKPEVYSASTDSSKSLSYHQSTNDAQTILSSLCLSDDDEPIKNDYDNIFSFSSKPKDYPQSEHDDGTGYNQIPISNKTTLNDTTINKRSDDLAFSSVNDNRINKYDSSEDEYSLNISKNMLHSKNNIDNQESAQSNVSLNSHKTASFVEDKILDLPKLDLLARNKNRAIIRGPRLMNSKVSHQSQINGNTVNKNPIGNFTPKSQEISLDKDLPLEQNFYQPTVNSPVNSQRTKTIQSYNTPPLNSATLAKHQFVYSTSNQTPVTQVPMRNKKLPSTPNKTTSKINYPNNLHNTLNYSNQNNNSIRATPASNTLRSQSALSHTFQNNIASQQNVINYSNHVYDQFEKNNQSTLATQMGPNVNLINNRNTFLMSPNNNIQYIPSPHNNRHLASPNGQNSALSNYSKNSPSRLGAQSRTQTPTNLPLRNIPLPQGFANIQNNQNNQIYHPQTSIQPQDISQNYKSNTISNQNFSKYYQQSTLIGGGVMNDPILNNKQNQFTLRSNNTDLISDLRMAQRMFTPFPSNIGTDQLPPNSYDINTIKKSNSLSTFRTANKDLILPGIKIPENVYGIITGKIKIGIQFSRSQVAQVEDPTLSAPAPYGVSLIQVIKSVKQVIKPGAKIAKMDEFDWTSIDKNIISLNKTVKFSKVSLESIASRYIGRQYKNQPYHQVRAIFSWIVNYITFENTDTHLNTQGMIQLHLSELPEIVYETQKSKGPGFAYLFHKIASLLNIECYVVHGTLKLPAPYPDSALSGPVYPLLPNHAWNVVCIEGEYRMIDTACASPLHPLNMNNFQDDGFFMAYPRNFIYTHFPSDPIHQYLSPYVSWPVFWLLPYVRPAFFENGVKLLNLVAPYLSIQEDTLLPLIMCLNDSSKGCYAEVVMYENYSKKVSQLPIFPKVSKTHPLLAQCMNYDNKRMVKILVGANSTDNRGVVNIYTGVRPGLLSKSAQVELMNIMANSDRENQKLDQNKTENFTQLERNSGTFSQRSRSNSVLNLSSYQIANPKQSIKGIFKHKRVNSETKLKQNEMDFNSPFVIGAPNSKTYELAITLPLHHIGKPCTHEPILTNHFSKSEFYIKLPTCRVFDIGSLVEFHIASSSTETKHYKLQLKSPSGHPTKFIFQPKDHSYTLTHTMREAGKWTIVYHSDTDGWVPIVMYESK
ncbi:hypothetical protein BB561_004117 [Smittium simulii]|uniref:SH3 domain-containing protein n=1 Tax=Smittium simulii TaxID=133385 RepID=A0A2T9YHX7_9FUNG|nr:hypothetical protein BB561_004117 [Smittium simulii]